MAHASTRAGLSSGRSGSGVVAAEVRAANRAFSCRSRSTPGPACRLPSSPMSHSVDSKGARRKSSCSVTSSSTFILRDGGEHIHHRRFCAVAKGGVSGGQIYQQRSVRRSWTIVVNPVNTTMVRRQDFFCGLTLGYAEAGGARRGGITHFLLTRRLGASAGLMQGLREVFARLWNV